MVTDALSEFSESITAGIQDLINEGGAWVPGAEGGILTSKRAYNEAALETRNVVNMSLFGGGGFYNYAAGLTTGAISEATVDSIAAAMGTNATLTPGRSNAASVDARNFFSANYLYQMGSVR